MHPFCAVLPRLLLPAPGIDLARWAVIACDQFTSEPLYWQQVQTFTGSAPSCLNLTLPEIYLSDNDSPRVGAIHRSMNKSLAAGTLLELPEGLMLVERDTGRGTPRLGVLLAFDLEAYDETPNAHTPIRPTEATVRERVPARLAIREKAPFELPHILLFVDDPSHALLEPLFSNKTHAKQYYDFELMEDGGHLTGHWMPRCRETDDFLARLAAHAASVDNYGLSPDEPPLVFATGDGNHSMSAAKAHWENVKRSLSPDEQRTHPARYVLAELVNLHDDSICFESVHRLLLNVNPSDALRFLARYFSDAAKQDEQAMLSLYYRCAGQDGCLTVPCAPDALPVSLLQNALDAYLSARPDAGIDFIHGVDTLRQLADFPSRLGFLLPDFEKELLFPYVLHHGVLPRKTFSMGTAHEKRYYLEGRRIR